MTYWLLIFVGVVLLGFWLFLPRSRKEKLSATQLGKDSAEFVNHGGYAVVAFTQMLLSLLMVVLDTGSGGLGIARRWIGEQPKRVDNDDETKGARADGNSR